MFPYKVSRASARHHGRSKMSEWYGVKVRGTLGTGRRDVREIKGWKREQAVNIVWP